MTATIVWFIVGRSWEAVVGDQLAAELPPQVVVVPQSNDQTMNKSRPNIKNSTMKTRIIASALVAAGLLCGSTLQSLAQAGAGAGRGPILSQEDRTAVMNSIRDEMTQLRADLQTAQKAAVEAALSKDATDADVQAKVEAVAKIQTKMAMTYCKAVKKGVKFTDDQTTQMKETPMRGYMTLFGGGFFGGGGRGGRAGGAQQ